MLEDAAELAEAQADLRQMARDIAAGDAGPSVLRRRLARKRAVRRSEQTRGRQDTDPQDTDPQDGDTR